MARRYEAITEHLRGCTEPIVTLSFRDLDVLVGGLPDSARRHNAWWTNTYTSHPQSRHWLDAGRRATPDFNAGVVRFEVGSPTPPRTGNDNRSGRQQPGTVIDLQPTGEIVSGEPRFEWLSAGNVRVDSLDKLRFPRLPDRPGIYRFTLFDADGQTLGIYVGESDNLHRRMATYRNAGPTQHTNIRLNERIQATLRDGGSISLQVATIVVMDDAPLDLTRI